MARTTSTARSSTPRGPWRGWRGADGAVREVEAAAAGSSIVTVSTEPIWSAAVRPLIEGRSVVTIGIGADQLGVFADAGATIVGKVAVVPAGAPTPPTPPRPPTPRPTPPSTAPGSSADHAAPLLALHSNERDIVDHVVRGYAKTLDDFRADVRRFLDVVDPAREAAVASYLPVPPTVLEGRDAWAQDAVVAAYLEDKSNGIAVLERAVPIVPGVPLPADAPEAWWSAVTSRFGTDRLVVQADGLWGGGSGTFVCDRPADVPSLASGRVMPFVDGMPGNVGGIVTSDGETVVLPPSRQLVAVDGRGHPQYRGNVTGERWTVDERAAIAAEVRALGRELASAGFVGPFGADFIRTSDDTRRFHEINARLNGVTDSYTRLLDLAPHVSGSPMPSVPSVPFVPLALAGWRARWTSAEADALEEALHDAVTATPTARLWLHRRVATPTHVERAPVAGAYRIELGSSRGSPSEWIQAVTFLGGDTSGGATWGGDVAVLQPTLATPMTFVEDDRLVVGDLFCDPALATRLQGSVPALIDALLA